MSKILNKLMMGFLVLVVVVSLVVTWKENLLAGGAAYDLLVAVFDAFPFANLTMEVAAALGKFQNTLRGLSPSNILEDVTKVFAMAVVCPMAIGLVRTIFLPVPQGDWYDREEYTKRFGYRTKELVIQVIMMPVCVLLTTVLVNRLQLWFQKELPFLNSNVISLVVLTAVFLASTLIQLVESPGYGGLIIRHRLIVDLLGSVLKIIGMNLICFFIALALINDQNNLILGYVVLLMIYLAGLELLLQCIMGLFK